jgi:CRP-like cAMP-binding protein
MCASIFDFFESYIRTHGLFSEEEIAMIMSLVIPRRLKKKQYLLRQGNVCRFHTFVCSGCLRSYQIDEKGNEHIFSLSPANHWVSDRVSLVTDKPSNEFIDALEDTDIMQLSADSFKMLLKTIPNFEALNTKIITDDCSTSRDRIYMMLSHQAEERYRQFIRRYPQLHERVPIYMIASYIGVSRETLTRIRSNIISDMNLCGKKSHPAAPVEALASHA